MSDELHYEVLVAWENWTGPAQEFYKFLGFSYKQMAGLIGRAKKMKREGYFGSSGFKQIHVDTIETNGSEAKPCQGIEIVWSDGKLIRFQDVDRLVKF